MRNINVNRMNVNKDVISADYNSSYRPRLSINKCEASFFPQMK